MGGTGVSERFWRDDERLSRSLDRIADAVEAHSATMVIDSLMDPDANAYPFVGALRATQMDHLRAADRLRSLSRSVAAHGLEPRTGRELSAVLRDIRDHHAREGDLLWRSLSEDTGVCD